MTFQEAHDLIDLLLDKSDQAYFTTSEKDKFLSMAIMEWFEDITSDYLKIADTESHEANKFVLSEERSFKEDSQINIHNNTSLTTPYPSLWSQGVVYPMYKLINLRVKTVSGDWEKVNPMRPGTLAVEDVKDPFNTPATGDRLYNFQENNLKIFPTTDLVSNDARVRVAYSGGAISSVTIIDGGAGYASAPSATSRDNSASTDAIFTTTIDGSGTVTAVAINNAGAGSSITGTELLKLDESPTSARFQVNYFTYPLLSNVAGGNFGGDDEADISTADAQLGAKTMAYAPYIWSDSGSSVKTLGCGPREAENIVKKAVRMMSANIEAPVYQVNSFEEKRSE